MAIAQKNDQQYQTEPDAGMLMPDWRSELTVKMAMPD